MTSSPPPTGVTPRLARQFALARPLFRAVQPSMVLAVLVLLNGCGSGPSPTPSSISTGDASASAPTVTATSAPAKNTVLPPATADSSQRIGAAQAVSPSTASNVSDGQQIFQAGLGPNGQPIPFSGGGTTMMMVTTTSCAGCHGQDGHGQRTPMFAAPDITYRNLTAPDGMIEASGEHGMVYTDDLIRRAVTQGVAPTAMR